MLCFAAIFLLIGNGVFFLFRLLVDVGWWCTFCGSGIAAIVIVLVWCQIFYCDGVVVIQVVVVACFFIDMELFYRVRVFPLLL